MEKYKNIDGTSKVAQFEIGSTFIEVEFDDRSLYVYTYNSAGAQIIEDMKKLAVKGQGLYGYIKQYALKKYKVRKR
jgi:hypothetical protein